MRDYLLLFVACALSGTAIPVPEDVTLVGAGATITDPFGFFAMVLVAAAGLLCRDATFFGIGHFAGEGVFRWRVVQRLVGDERIARGRALVEQQGGRAVLVSRFLIGVRSTSFLVSGAMGVRPRDFLFWDLLGLAITTPLMLLLGYALGEPILAGVSWILAHKWIVVVVAVVGLGIWGLRVVRSRPEPEGDAPPEL
ncbi:MAG: DedA family protein [Alphaproteobacteria bacterium]|nr:DedA family protein [Alphaproteobacteria bacterium]